MSITFELHRADRSGDRSRPRPNAATPMVQAVGPERLAEMTATVPAGRFADPAEMATAIGYLAADESAYVTGVVLPVDGGLSM